MHSLNPTTYMCPEGGRKYYSYYTFIERSIFLEVSCFRIWRWLDGASSFSDRRILAIYHVWSSNCARNQTTPRSFRPVPPSPAGIVARCTQFHGITQN
jgi:hypothetical protein